MDDQSNQFLEVVRDALKPELDISESSVLSAWTGRFSLRTLLIAMTLIAFLLSVIGVVVTQANKAPSTTAPTTTPTRQPQPHFPTNIKQF